MESVSPVVPGTEQFEIIYAKDQPEYNQLAVLQTEKALLSRWRLSADERQKIAEGGDLFICVLHFGGHCSRCGAYNGLQPILPIIDTPDNALAILVEVESAA